MSQNLRHTILTKDRNITTSYFEPFVEKIRQLHPAHIQAILAYGSTLNQTTISSTSTPDFYVIVDDYDSFFNRGMDRFLGRHLPPNIYHTEIQGMRYKYCVITMKHLIQEVGRSTRDAYHLGRFSKRLGIIWTANQDFENQVVHAQILACKTVATKVLQSLEQNFTLDDFIFRTLLLSYQGDVRIEAADKIQKIMNSEKEYYRSVYGEILSEFSLPQENDTYRLNKNGWKKFWDRIKFNRFIQSSRIRARLRWPKNMFTVENWLDYILAKIERTQGIKITLTPRERKYWYIFGWRHFIRLYRKKLIK